MPFRRQCEIDAAEFDPDDLERRVADDFAEHLVRDQAPAGALGLLDWGRLYLPGHFRLPPSAMHVWLAERLDAMRLARGARLNVLGPRGGAKSTIGTLAYPLRAAVEGWEPYIWIISDTRHQASSHLENVKAELLDNTLLAAAYPAATSRGTVWRDSTIVLPNGVSVQSFGTGQRIRGRRFREHRPTLIVCDDLQNDRHMESSVSREHSRRWFHGTLLKAGAGGTNVVNLATALHREALALELVRTPGWTSGVFRAIQRWPDDMLLWEEWEALFAADTPGAAEAALEFFERHRERMQAGAELLWPEWEDLYSLMRLRAEGGHSAFEREKQGTPATADLCEWPDSYFGAHIWFEAWPGDPLVKAMALDPSKGRDDRRGDYSAFVLLAIDRTGLIYLEGDLARRPTPQIVADGVDLYRKFQPHAFAIEANQYQDLLAVEFEQEFQRRGLWTAAPWLLHNDTNKRVRIRRLGGPLASRRLRFKADSPSTRLLVEQMRSFPLGDHDDGPDAAEMALRLARLHLEGTAASEEVRSIFDF